MLLIGQSNTLDESFNFTVLFIRIRVATLKIIEQIQVFSGRQQIKVDIVLGADAEELPDLVEFSNHIDPKYLSSTFARLVEASKTGNEGRLASAIMS
jgi:hypothetical protein